MTRIAVVGTSNIGCIKYQAETLAQAWPGFEITCYGLPGARFYEAHARETGMFGPPDGDRKARQLAKQINGVARIDLSRHDAVFVIADTLGMAHALWMAKTCDVADWPTRRGKTLISAPAFEHAMREAIDSRVGNLARQFAGIRPLHVALAPFPTTAVIPEGPYHQQPYATMAAHPEAGRLHEIYTAALVAALEAQDIRYVSQPPETVAQPFLTQERFGIGALDFRQEGRVLDDHRHMNPAFGASLFRAFALTLPQSQRPGSS